jgi:hypothetical protein
MMSDVRSVSAQLTLSGGGLTLVEEGGSATVPMNLATGATPFASSDLGPEIGVAFHVAANLNDQVYGNSNSWIGGDTNPFSPDVFAGIDLGALAMNVQSIAFGRDNLGGFGDRVLGLYTLQYTQIEVPSGNLDSPTTGDPATGWADIGTLDYGASDGPGTNYNEIFRRHRYNFDPVAATGVRLMVPATGLGGGTDIDEIELYNVAGDFVPPPPPPPPVGVNPADGFAIIWDGNDGDHFDPTPPPAGAVAPDNLALASNGATPISSSDLGPELGIAFHVAENLNDGFYGNSNSWISASADPGPAAFAGVNLGGTFQIDRIAWGRDNGNGAVDDSDPGTDACGGQCDDRWPGLYTLQYTQIADPDAATADTGDASTGWATIGTVDFQSNEDLVVGGSFTGFLRHEFGVSLNGDPLTASGVRLVVPAFGLSGGTAIDEIEVYQIPEPSSFALTAIAMLGMLGRRRRQR